MPSIGIKKSMKKQADLIQILRIFQYFVCASTQNKHLPDMFLFFKQFRKNKTILCLGLSLIMTSPLFSQRWKSLFNGKDLSGWTNNGKEKWYVENHELICESGPEKQYGYLSTDKSYQNFVLSLQFKQEANGNSGVFFRSSIDGIKISGWQAEIAPPGLHTGGIYESYGREWLAKPDAEGEKALKFGEWNTYVIYVEGDHVTTTLNGHRIVDIHDEKIGQGKGFIALQIHSGGGIRVRWKNIKIKVIK
jgi:hypothetical protein